jgi:predicted NUDIX family NTP pyrophosphohydrolase
MRKTAAPPKRSAAIILFRRSAGAIEVLLIHPGGPFWKNKDEGAWSIPKGLYEPGEVALTAAKREFKEETGSVPDGAFVYLGEFRLPSGKRLAAWAVEDDLGLGTFRSETFRMEWPPRSGRFADFPEADRAAWFPRGDAMRKITTGQRPILEALFKTLGYAPDHKG